MAIARVFPRATACTPKDEYAFVGDIPLFFPEDITEVHVSVTFSWDLPEAERLARAWGRIAPVKSRWVAVDITDIECEDRPDGVLALVGRE